MKKNHVKSVSMAVFVVVVFVCCIICSEHYGNKYYIEQAETEEIEYVEETDISDNVVAVECNIKMFPYQEKGYANLKEYYDDMRVKNEDVVGVADEAAAYYADVITEEQKELLYEYEDVLSSTLSYDKYEKYYYLLEDLLAELDDAMAAVLPVYYSNSDNSGNGGGYYTSNGNCLTRSGGVFWFNGRRETWYSQNVLPGGGLNIPGRHVAADGTIRDADGYIVVASGDHEKGAVVDTSLGAGKVYDYCETSGTTDVYVNW